MMQTQLRRHVSCLWFLSVIVVTLLVAPGRRQVAAFQMIRAASKKAKSTTTSISATSRREILLSFPSSALIPGGMFLLTPPPSIANAATTGEVSSSSYQGVYSDPQHPKGYRILYGDSKKATMKLADGPNNSDMYEIPVKVVSSNKAGGVQPQQLIFDFSQNGGPSNVVGVVDDNSIIFPADTTKNTTPAWVKVTNDIAGVYKCNNNNNPDLQYDYVTVRKWGKGAEWKVEFIQGSDTIASFGAKAGSQKGYFEYPGEFNKAGFIDRENNTITFRDGIVWTRF